MCLLEYISFIILLGSLFLISGGVYVKGSLNGTPLANTGLMALGAVIASFIGTTGAIVLLIRPLLRANKAAQHKAHIVIFFIFIVSQLRRPADAAGRSAAVPGLHVGRAVRVDALQPLAEWLIVNLALLVIFHIWDQLVFAKEEKERARLAARRSDEARAAGHQRRAQLPVPGGRRRGRLFQRDLQLAVGRAGRNHGLDGGARLMSRRHKRIAPPTSSRSGPIIEVAVLFIGIFITMAPALQILNAWGSGDREVLGMEFGMTEPWQFFWATGSPVELSRQRPDLYHDGRHGRGTEGRRCRRAISARIPATSAATLRSLLAAISCGAVFMGANTYIGNGPNFMVKAIADENGVKMPSFFGYMVYSGLILIPIFVVVTVIFFRA